MVSRLESAGVITFIRHTGVFSDPFNKLSDTPSPTNTNARDTSYNQAGTVSKMFTTTERARLSTTSVESKTVFVGNNPLSSTSQSSTSSFMWTSTSGLLQQTTSAGIPLTKLLTSLLLFHL